MAFPPAGVAGSVARARRRGRRRGCSGLPGSARSSEPAGASSMSACNSWWNRALRCSPRLSRYSFTRTWSPARQRCISLCIWSMRGAGRPARRFQAEAASPAPVPRLELHLCAASAFAVVLAFIVLGGVVFEVVGCRTVLGLCQKVVLVHQRRVGEVAGQGVEYAAAHRSVLHAEVIAVQQVVGGHVVQAGNGFRAITGQYPAYDEINNHPPHLAQELRNGHNLVGSVGLLDYRVLAEGFKRRSCGCPNEVRSANPRVPEVPQLLGDVLPHLAKDGVVPTRTSRSGRFLRQTIQTDEDEGS